MIFSYPLRRGLTIALAVVFVFTALSVITTTPADGRPFRMAKIPPKGKVFGCAVCHINPKGGGPRNLFGEDYEKFALSAGDKYTKALGERDSDGDGFSNDAEFKAGTHPGDPNSAPKK